MIRYSMQPEARLSKKIMQLIRERGGWCTKIHGGDNPFQEAGLPDIFAVYRGYPLGIESKMPGNGPSPKQKIVLLRMARAGCITVVAYSVGDVEKVLSELDGKGDGAIKALPNRRNRGTTRSTSSKRK